MSPDFGINGMAEKDSNLTDNEKKKAVVSDAALFAVSAAVLLLFAIIIWCRMSVYTAPDGPGPAPEPVFRGKRVPTIESPSRPNPPEKNRNANPDWSGDVLTRLICPRDRCAG
jgi:hypothetical protein